MPRNISQLLEPFRCLAAHPHAIQARLIECERCGSGFVNPMAWHERGELYWWIRLRCGECGFVREVEVTDDEAERFEGDLDQGVRTIVAILTRLGHERITADALTTTPGRDYIDPGDFRCCVRRRYQDAAARSH